nr:hypothetical protein B0A51_15616 [Rachicladosporium sp. CCFEE 5018]
MAYQYQQSSSMSATFVPGGFDDFYQPPPPPELVAPEPQRHMPEMSTNIQQGIQNMSFNRESTPGPVNYDYNQHAAAIEVPHLSPFPKVNTTSASVPPSDDELEATLEAARVMVLNSNDPEMQLAWAADVLVYVGVSADNAEREAAVKALSARPATPRIEYQLKEDAKSIVTFLADQHHPKAEFLRGMWLEWGRFGEREDKKEAFRCYSRAADRGYARAEYRIGMLYESYNDPAKALRHYNRGIDAGDAASCYRLGMMTLRGQHGQPLDHAKAIELIRTSAQKADENAAQGAYVYGMLLARQLPQLEIPESVLPFNEYQARVNIEKAAYLKFAKAQTKMGSAYELGSLGCPFDPALSMHYNALASRQGEAEADMALSKWFLVGHEGLFAKNEELSYTYAQRAAHLGLSTGEFALGYFNEIGMYVPVDLNKSLEWYTKASNNGNEDAKGRIEALARKQVLSRKDHETVAITRIKSQYGSQHGVRPERFKQAQPSRLAQSMTADGNGASYSQTETVQQPPPRASSITPYPVEDGPPTVPGGVRPASIAPYPLEDGLPPHASSRLGPSGGFFNASHPPRPATTINADMRPSSAFQLSPDLRSSSTHSLPQVPVHQQYPNPRPQQPPINSGYPPARPTTALHSPDPRVRLGAGQRIASGPANMQPYQQQRPPPLSVPSTPQPSQLQQSQFQPQSPAQRLDIGFVAPPDDRRARQYGPRPSPSPAVTSQSGRLPMQAEAQPASTSSRLPAPPPDTRVSPKPNAANATPPKLPVKDTTPSKPAGGAGAGTAKPPGKGPKTFEEMGVPASKKEGECCVM